MIFPLVLGKYAGDQSILAIFGLLLTAVAVPIMGFIAMLLYKGSYNDFFGRLGKVPGFILAFFIISLLGPLGSAPRCIAVGIATFKGDFPEISSWIFSALACILIFLCTTKKRFILPLLGWVLTPVLLISLFTIIVIGFFTAGETSPTIHSKSHLFFHGLQEGYNTMDLLAAFFFSSTILKSLNNRERTVTTVICASLIGAGLLCVTYLGFFKLAALHGGSLVGQKEGELLGAIAMKIAGPHGSILVRTTVILACLTTGIALISSFTEFMQKEIFKEKISYNVLLILSLMITFTISTFEYTGISSFLSPILKICYPGLILLTVINIGSKFRVREGESL